MNETELKKNDEQVQNSEELKSKILCWFCKNKFYPQRDLKRHQRKSHPEMKELKLKFSSLINYCSKEQFKKISEFVQQVSVEIKGGKTN